MVRRRVVPVTQEDGVRCAAHVGYWFPDRSQPSCSRDVNCCERREARDNLVRRVGDLRVRRIRGYSAREHPEDCTMKTQLLTALNEGQTS